MRKSLAPAITHDTYHNPLPAATPCFIQCNCWTACSFTKPSDRYKHSALFNTRHAKAFPASINCSKTVVFFIIIVTGYYPAAVCFYFFKPFVCRYIIKGRYYQHVYMRRRWRLRFSGGVVYALQRVLRITDAWQANRVCRNDLMNGAC